MSLALVSNINQGKKLMPSTNGYVNLWRDIERQPWADDAVTFGVFTKLMLRVQHKPYTTEYKGVMVALQPGERVLSYDDIINMFKQVTDKDHAKRLIKKFKSLSQVYTREVKDNNVHVGFILGFFGWEKWQNCTPPQTTPTTTPNPTNIKALQGGETTPQTPPQTTHINNNVLNNLKNNAGFDNQRVSFLELRENAFNHYWKTWSDAKKLIGLKNTASKQAAKTSFMKLFTDSSVGRLGVEGFEIEIDSLCRFAWYVHADIAHMQSIGKKSDWSSHFKMWPPKFLSYKQWREDNWRDGKWTA